MYCFMSCYDAVIEEVTVDLLSSSVYCFVFVFFNLPLFFLGWKPYLGLYRYLQDSSKKNQPVFGELTHMLYSCKKNDVNPLEWPGFMHCSLLIIIIVH